MIITRKINSTHIIIRSRSVMQNSMKGKIMNKILNLTISAILIGSFSLSAVTTSNAAGAFPNFDANAGAAIPHFPAAGAGNQFAFNPNIRVPRPRVPGAHVRIPRPPVFRPPARRPHHGRGNGAAVAGIVGGLIVGAAIAGSNRRYEDRRYRERPVYRSRGGSSAHIEWCLDHYRSYRMSDDTFQPYRGGRRYCNSPYN